MIVRNGSVRQVRERRSSERRLGERCDALAIHGGSGRRPAVMTREETGRIRFATSSAAWGRPLAGVGRRDSEANAGKRPNRMRVPS